MVAGSDGARTWCDESAVAFKDQRRGRDAQGANGTGTWEIGT
jgi:hypothetical protein